LIGQISDSLKQGLADASYVDGLAGFGVGIEYMIKKQFFVADADEILGDIDNAVRRFTPQYLFSSPEISRGMTGLGKYYSERLANRTVMQVDNPNYAHLLQIIQALSCPYDTYRELLSVINFLSGIVPMGIEREKTVAYLNYAVDKMETMVYEDLHFGKNPGQFNPLVAAMVLCQASKKLKNGLYAEKAHEYLQLYEHGYRRYLKSNTPADALKWGFLYRYFGDKFQNGEFTRLSENWLNQAMTQNVASCQSLGLLTGLAGAGMFLLTLNGLCNEDWIDIVPFYIL